MAGLQRAGALERGAFGGLHPREQLPVLPGPYLNHDDALTLLRSQAALEVNLRAASPHRELQPLGNLDRHRWRRRDAGRGGLVDRLLLRLRRRGVRPGAVSRQRRQGRERGCPATPVPPRVSRPLSFTALPNTTVKGAATSVTPGAPAWLV